MTLLDDYNRTSLGWQQANLKIVDKKSRLVPLNHNIAQLKVHNAAELQRKRGLPVMLCIVKARKEGISTKIEADIFERINRGPNRHGCIASKDKTSTAKVFNMCEVFQEEMPTKLKRPTDRSSTREIRYKAPWRSSMLCQTAGAQMLGRGGTTQYIHATEVAFWANAKTQLLGLVNEVPDEPDTMIVLESTANGVVGAFFEEYWKAVERLRNDSEDYAGYLPISLSWQEFPEYRMLLPPGCKEVPHMTSELRQYIDEGLAMRIKLSDEQTYFAHLTCQNKCGGDFNLFKQEYPRTAREAFQSSGRMVFGTVSLDVMEQACRPPSATIEFYEDEGKVKYRHVNRRENCWSIWKWPQSNHSYCCFGDVAEGVLSDPNNPKSDPDRSVAGIFDRNDRDIPITYYGRPDTIEFGDQMLLASKYFNFAWASPEMNSIGQSVLDTFKRADYQFIYQREHKEETVQREDSAKLGWKTTILTRKPMIADLQEVIKNQEIMIYDIRFINELRVFIWDEHGKPRAETGEHDDCVITLAGLVQLHQRCPLDDDFSWADDTQKEEVNMAIANVVATDDEDEDPMSLLCSEDLSDL